MARVIESIAKAMRAEEKQGYINTGAIGGFGCFLREILWELQGVFTAEVFNELLTLASEYEQASPAKRKALFPILKRHLKDLKEELPADLPAAAQPAAAQQAAALQHGGSAGQVLSRRADHSIELQYVKGVGPRRVKQLENIGIHTLEDLLRYFPRKYEIRIKRRIEDLKDNELVSISGKVVGSQVSSGRVKVVKLNIEQEGKNIYAVWFNQVFIVKQYPVGTFVTVTGKVQWNRQVPELLASDIVKGDGGVSAEEIVPVYAETAGLTSKIIRGIVKAALPQAVSYFPEIFPEAMVRLPQEKEKNCGAKQEIPADIAEKLMYRPEAYRQIHFPISLEEMKKARARLVIEEILLLQLALALLRRPQDNRPSVCLNKGGGLVRTFITNLPFRLTAAQKRVIQEIFADLANEQKAMARLLQGDVGSGKTVVAMAAILQAVGSGFQAALMAPTEVLAQQHYASLREAFAPLGVQVVLLTGSQGKSEKEQVLEQIADGSTQVVVGTHALIQETVRFRNLGIVVTDEQHRFGVRQRALLQDKGVNPHVLVMTATPIPRTLALTLYGDLQLSVLNEMPPGRKPVITKKISDRSRPNLENFLEKQLQAGRQIYVVCPLVTETEKSDLVSAEKTAEALSRRFQNRSVALLHGRLKSQEKEGIMDRFRRGEIDILVSTTVIEVGVDVPNASVMVVEDAERFGLAQLHQLRGRVGRGKDQSYCILISNTRASARLNILCQTEDGFKIAEADLKIRGPGELLGLRQHGVPELKLADLSKDGRLVEEAYRILQKAIADPQKYRRLYEESERLYPWGKSGIN